MRLLLAALLAAFSTPALASNDPFLDQATAVIKSSYGDTVSAEAKAKNLRKFGRNRAVGNAWETVAELQSTTANETFVSTNIIDSLVCDQAADTSITFTIEGHTISASGVLTFVTQNATTNASDGRTEVTLTTPMARANRMFVANSGTFNSPQAAPTGNCYIYDNTDGITTGVPNTAAASKMVLVAGETQSEKAATSVSDKDYWIITSFSTALGDTAVNVDYATVRMEIRDVKNGGVWRPFGRDYTLWPNEVGIRTMFEPYVIVPKDHDWRVRAKTDANTAEVYAEAAGYLVSVTKLN